MKNKDDTFRDFALNGNVWKVVINTSLPLCFYNTMLLFFKLVDSMMASYVSANSVSAVAFLGQLNSVLLAVGGGLAVGGSLEISRAYGLGDYDLVKKRVNSLYFITTLVCLAILIMLPFSTQILRFVNTPSELIDIGNRYFRIEMLNLILVFYNNVYFSIERVRGNSSRILYLNVISVLVKLSLSAYFIYVLKSDIQMIALSNLISQALLFVIGIINLSDKTSIFRLSTKDISLKKRVIKPMLTLGFPVIIERAAFSLGKVVVNSMTTVYGPLVVGALGISNSIGALTQGPNMGLYEAGSAIISQNLGANKKERAIDVFYKVLIINVIFGFIGLFLSLYYIEFLTAVFSHSSEGNNIEFQKMIIRIYSYEAWGGCVPLAVNTSIVALLLGFGYSNLTLIINFCRVFVFRVPVFYLFQRFTNLGYETCGIIMLISNLCVSLLSSAIAFAVIRRLKKRIKEENMPLVEVFSE